MDLFWKKEIQRFRVLIFSPFCYYLCNKHSVLFLLGEGSVKMGSFDVVKRENDVA